MDDLLEAIQSIASRSIEFGGTPERLRGWVILTLEGAEVAGISPVPHRRFHQLLFYAAVLTPIYKVEQPLPLIIKSAEGPYYPEAQHELERLIVAGFAMNYGRHRYGPLGTYAFVDSYMLTEEGQATAAMLAQSDWGTRARALTRALALGMATVPADQIDAVLLQDPLLRSREKDAGATVDVTEFPNNFSYRVAHWLADLDENDISPSRQEQISLYFRYLQARRERGLAA